MLSYFLSQGEDLENMLPINLELISTRIESLGARFLVQELCNLGILIRILWLTKLAKVVGGPKLGGHSALSLYRWFQYVQILLGLYSWCPCHLVIKSLGYYSRSQGTQEKITK